MTLAAHPPRTIGLAPASTADRVDLHFAHRGHGEEFEMEVAWILRHLPTEATRVLDVGCGNGALFDALGPGRTTGLDYCAAGLTHTRAAYSTVPLMCADATRLPVSSKSFDIITAQHVIEHLEASAAACRDWHRVLRPGGLLLLLTPNVRFIDPGVFEDETHVCLYNEHSLTERLVHAGFEIVELCSLGLPWFRSYQRLPSGWRFRRMVTRQSSMLARVPWLRWRGQTLCCCARRPVS